MRYWVYLRQRGNHGVRSRLGDVRLRGCGCGVRWSLPVANTHGKVAGLGLLFIEFFEKVGELLFFLLE